MVFGHNKSVIFLFLSLFRCLTEKDNEFKEKIKKYKISETYLHSNELPKVTYNVELFQQTENGAVGKDFMMTILTHNNNKKYSMEMYDNNAIKNFIKKLKHNKKCNYLIKFFYAFGAVELRKFVKFFFKKLEDNKIEHVEISYQSKFRSEDLYRSTNFYIELENNDIVLKKVRHKDDGNSLVKVIISKEDLLSEMEIDFDLYAKNFNIPKYVGLFRKYFLNYKLLSLNIDYFNTETLLERFPSENKTYSERIKFNESTVDNILKIFKLDRNPKLTYINILFYLLQDSATMDSMILDAYSTNKKRELFSKIINKYNRNDGDENNDTKDKIKSINIEDYIREYKTISNYFYSYLTNKKFSELNDLIEIIKIIVDKQKEFEETNLKVFKRLIHLLNRLEEKHSDAFNYDLFHENKYIS